MPKVVEGAEATFKKTVTVASTDDASSKTAGAVMVAGGIACEKKLHVGTSITSDSGDLSLVDGTIHVQNGATIAQGSGSGKATGVTSNTESAQITMDNAQLNSATAVTFVVTNSKSTATSTAVLNHVSGGTLGAYMVHAHGFTASQFSITVTNITSGNLSEALVLRYVLVHGAHS
jgi:hypothetical protein